MTDINKMKDIFRYHTFNIEHINYVHKHVFNSSDGTVQYTVYTNVGTIWACTDKKYKKMLELPDLLQFSEEEYFQYSLVWGDEEYSIPMDHIYALQKLAKITNNIFWEPSTQKTWM